MRKVMRHDKFPGHWARRRASIGGSLVAWVVTIVFFVPVLALVVTSLKTENAAYSGGFFLNFSPTLHQYAQVLSGAHDFFPYLVHSLEVSVGSGFVIVVLATMLCYTLVFGGVRRTNDILFFFISTKVMPVAATVVPLYLVVRYLHLLNQPWVLGVIYVGVNLPIGVWLIWSALKDIPGEIVEAALLDGASSWRLILSIVLPIAAGGIASAWLLCFVFGWSEFFFALSLTTTNTTLPVFLTQFESYGVPYIAQLSAAAVFISIPPVLAGWFSQRYLIRSLSGSGK